MKLYGWHSSSTTFRVRIALGLKGLSVEHESVNLSWQDSDHDRPEYRAFNPQANIPVLIGDDGAQINQSLAIIEYLEEIRPEPSLFPRTPAERARVRALALFVACEIQPPNNLRVQRELARQFGVDLDSPGMKGWQRHWFDVGFDALEAQLSRSPATGQFCHGDRPTVADCFLIPQVYSSQRPLIGADLSRWPTICRIYETCLSLPSFERALPRNQPGYASPVGH